MYYGATAVVTDDGDMIDENKLITHPTLNKNQAKAAAHALEQLKTKSVLTAGIDFKPKGVSGPEMYTAFKRLQPEFLVSFISDPTAWEHRSLMPNAHIKEKDVHKLVNYLKTIG